MKSDLSCRLQLVNLIYVEVVDHLINYCMTLTDIPITLGARTTVLPLRPPSLVNQRGTWLMVHVWL